MGQIKAVTPRGCPYLKMLGPALVLAEFGAVAVAAFGGLCAISYKPLVDMHL